MDGTQTAEIRFGECVLALASSTGPKCLSSSHFEVGRKILFFRNTVDSLSTYAYVRSL